MIIARSLSSILWMKQLAIRLGCKQPQPSRWLSRKEPLSLTLSRKREKGQTRKAILNPWARRQEPPHLNPLDETTSHSTRLQTAAAKSLVIPQAGEEANEKSNYQYLNRYASFTLTR